jgi:hypothetical protein
MKEREGLTAAVIILDLGALTKSVAPEHAI